MSTEDHSTSVNTWHNGLHGSIVKKMLNGIFVSCFNRNCYTDVLSIRNLILRICFKIPQLKLIGSENGSLIFVSKLIGITTGSPELYIPGKLNT